ADLRFRELGKELSNQVEYARVRRWVGARRIADRVLVHVDDLVDLLQSKNLIVSSSAGSGAVQLSRERVVKDLVDQGTLAGAAHPGHRDEGAQRKSDINVL